MQDGKQQSREERREALERKRKAEALDPVKCLLDIAVFVGNRINRLGEGGDPLGTRYRELTTIHELLTRKAEKLKAELAAQERRAS